MNFSAIIAIIFCISVFEFLLIWLGSYFLISDYTNFGCDVIWISKNRTFNWFFTYFFPAHAIMYERLCERVNGDGLAILLILLSLITLPTTCLMTLIGGIVLFIRFIWHRLCRTFARKEGSK